MSNRPSLPYISATFSLFLLTVVGAWLPWVRKLPNGCMDGQLYVTDEGLHGLYSGFTVLDQLLIGAVLLAVCVTVLARFWGWSPDVVVVLSGGVVLWLASEIGYEYWRVDNYVPQVGFYVTIASGLLLVALGVRSIVTHHLGPRLKPVAESWSE